MELRQNATMNFEPKLNDALIPHYHCASIPIEILKQQVSLNEDYLKEKNTWYVIEKVLKYFKSRNDSRLFTELFSSEFGRQIMDLDTLNYQLASISVRVIDKKGKQREEKKLGLLSDNFQKPGYNYYLVSELLNSEISDLVCYSGYSLLNLLTFFKQILSKEDYEVVKDYLIRLFINDAFLLQEDRHSNNIGFEIPKIEDISYKQRLRPNLLQNNPQAADFIVLEDEIPKLKGFRPTKVYDSERILGIDHKNVIHYTPGMTWCSLFAYNNDLLFFDDQGKVSQERAELVSKEEYSGLDPNLTELYLNHPKESKPYIERLACDDEYRRILEQFSIENDQIYLSSQTKEYCEGVLEERRKVFKKVLSI